MVDAVDVPISESHEKWSEFLLEDGTTVRLRATLVSIARVDSEYDGQGNPTYVVSMTPSVAILNVAENLKQGAKK